MANCLVTKLKASVNDDSLEKFQYVRGVITVPPSGSWCIAVIKNGATVSVYNRDVEDTPMSWTGDGNVRAYAVRASWGTAGAVINVEFYNKNDFVNVINNGYVGVDLEGLYAHRISTTAINAANSKSFGNIEGLYRLTSLDAINVNNCANTIGDIRILAERMVAEGRTSGTLDFYASNSGITLDGSAITTKRITFDSSVSGGYTIGDL